MKGRYSIPLDKYNENNGEIEKYEISAEEQEIVSGKRQLLIY